jgi:hypothetical protein
MVVNRSLCEPVTTLNVNSISRARARTHLISGQERALTPQLSSCYAGSQVAAACVYRLRRSVLAINRHKRRSKHWSTSAATVNQADVYGQIITKTPPQVYTTTAQICFNISMHKCLPLTHLPKYLNVLSIDDHRLVSWIHPALVSTLIKLFKNLYVHF